MGKIPNIRQSFLKKMKKQQIEGKKKMWGGGGGGGCLGGDRQKLREKKRVKIQKKGKKNIEFFKNLFFQVFFSLRAFSSFWEQKGHYNLNETLRDIANMAVVREG
jgi:hypothetical protein